MYKRKARIVFWCAEQAGYGLLARAFADRIGADWLETHAVGIDSPAHIAAAIATLREIGIELIGARLTEPSDELLAWADLVVTLGRDAEVCCPALPSHVQKKHWPLAGANVERDSADDIARAFRVARDDIRARVEGVVGGLRLLAKSDRGDA